MRTSVRLASIHVYPVKGARGVTLSSCGVEKGGLRHDRRFMVIDHDGTFLSQREHPRLALVDVALGGESMRLSSGGGSGIDVLLAPPKAAPRRAVKIWDDTVEASVIAGAGEFFSDVLGVACELVVMPEDVLRPVNPKYAQDGDRVGFADAYPVLVASLASLADLNARLDTAAPIDRFRANLVVEGGAAFEEDRFPRARIGEVTFRMPKKCARCDVVLVDQATGAKGKEPLRTLATYRTEQNKVNFAMNAIPDTLGTVRVGDAVDYLS